MEAQARRERKDVEQYLLQKDWNVFGTLKFTDGRRISVYGANKTLFKYWVKVDQVFFGYASKRQKIRAPRLCFAHGGADANNYHVHFALLSPVPDVERACCVLNALWSQQHWQTAPVEKNWIMPVENRSKVANYLVKEYWKLGAATWLDKITWQSTNAGQMAECTHDRQAARLDKAVNKHRLRQTQQALAEQMDHYRRDPKDFLFTYE